VPSTIEAGHRYLKMGYTMAVEPAIVPSNARHAHLELSDTQYLDTAGLLLLGNDDLLLRWLSEGASASQIRDYVGWMVQAHQCLGVKVVNAGGINAFRFGVNEFSLDSIHPRYRCTGRQILCAIADAVDELGLPHPMHVHCSQLGMAGNIETTLATIEAVRGRRIHLAHAQFHAYGTDGPMGFSSAADRLADAVNRNPNVSLDVGQVIFGQTVTISADIAHQFANRRHADPRKVIFQTSECQTACGVVPFRYRDEQYVHSLQWTIGLELLLRIQDPYRVFLTTDHPNGGPFTAYPHLIRLLMDREFRRENLARLHPDVQKTSPLGAIQREYTLDEVAIITRAGPARILGMNNIGRLQAGCLADVVVYSNSANAEKMFAHPRYVFRNGKMVLRDQQIIASADKSTWTARVEFDKPIEKFIDRAWFELYGGSAKSTIIGEQEFPHLIGSSLQHVQPVPVDL
jgi:formylmethanofuran dehydrogenase subunit A